MTLLCPIDGTPLRVLTTWFSVEFDGFVEHVQAICTAAPISHMVIDRLHALEAASGP